MKILFLVPRYVAIKDVLSWSPDCEPTRYADAISHGFFQLFLELRELYGEEKISISYQIEECDILLVFARLEYSILQNLSLLWALLISRPNLKVLSILSDTPADRLSVFFYSARVVPNCFRLEGPFDFFVPLLPQNSLICPLSRLQRVVGVVCSKKYFPRHVLDDDFLESLQAMGLGFEARFVDDIQPGKEFWDLSPFGVLLCLRGGSEIDQLRKPPTKLINCWNAGVIPVIDREPGYLSVAQPYFDSVLLDCDHRRNPEGAKVEIVDVLKKIFFDDLGKRLHIGIQHRSDEFDRHGVCRAYMDVFHDVVNKDFPFVERRRVLIKFLRFGWRKIFYKPRYSGGLIGALRRFFSR